MVGPRALCLDMDYQKLRSSRNQTYAWAAIALKNNTFTINFKLATSLFKKLIVPLEERERL